MICRRKHRVWSPKHRLVRNIPETFKGLGLSQQSARDIIDTFLDQYLCIVFPRLIISADSFYVVCFVSWIDIIRLKKMGFDIKDIKYV